MFAALILWLQVFGLAIHIQAQERQEKGLKRSPLALTNKQDDQDEADDPDLPAASRIDKTEYLRLRDEQIAKLRGLPYPRPDVRNQAIFEAMREEVANRRLTGEPDAAINLTWRPLGPAPIPQGQTVGRRDPVSGRVSAIAVHPTNPNIVYVGTAQGGLYRSLNGGTTWTPLLDNALSLAIGAIAIAPSDPTIVYVGTGEATFSQSSFFGVGIYRITNADTTPVIAGPLNAGTTAGSDVFTGRAISEILIHPTDANIIFAATTSGTSGIGGNTGAPTPTRGVYRSTNALAASPTFERLTVSTFLSGNRSISDLAMEPGNPNRIFVSLVDTGNGGNDAGVYFTSNALDPTPTFTRVLTVAVGDANGRSELTINKVGATVTAYAATGTANGTVYKTTYDTNAPGTPTFTQTVANSFCGGQCFYDIAIAVDANDANKVYLGGGPALPFGISTNGGTSFVSSSTGLHVDTQAITVAPSDPNTIYFGSDGGVWKSTNGGTNWTSLNNSTFSATQFQSIALHPLDRNFTIGGTQDNGTEFFAVDGATWVHSDDGDGGFAAIDQNAINFTNVTAYHTYFNASGSQIGFARATTGDPVTGDLNWDIFLGCGGTANGINCADSTLFYAPMVVGPGRPNTLYFGTNRLYRSADTGTTMVAVSQALPSPASAIAISKQDDNVRLVGLSGGGVYVTTTGSATLNSITGAIPARYVGRAAIDPTNANIAYVTLTGYGLPAGQHVWKTTNLNDPAPTWTASGSGIPDVPTDSFVIDPANPQQLFAGTDIGVFRSTNGGTSWTSFNDGLPRVAVFGMDIQPSFHVLKIATHGRGIWEMPLNVPTTSTPFDFDGDGRADISVFRPSTGVWYLNRSTAGILSVSFGVSSDLIAPGDFDGDGKADIAVFRPSNGTWYSLNSQTNTVSTTTFGQSGDLPRPGDFDGDGKADISVFRPSNGAWYRLNSSNNAFVATQFGQSGDVPVLGDFDGDAKSDLAVFRPSTGVWYRLNSNGGTFAATPFGQSGDIPTAADYDGDGKADISVFRPSTGVWYRLNSNGGAFAATPFGQSGDIPTAADYDGDGKADISVFRPSTGVWYRLNSNGGAVVITQFGQTGDLAVPNAYDQ